MKHPIQKSSSRRWLIILAAVLCTSLLFSCGKGNHADPSDGDGTSNSGSFNPKDFQISNIHAHQDDPQSTRILYIDYTIKNVSSRDYKDYFNVKWKVKGSDGAYYEGSDEPGSLNAGASQARSNINIDMGTDGNMADISTLTYKITYQY